MPLETILGETADVDGAFKKKGDRQSGKRS
jgi:hypothetical protein